MKISLSTSLLRALVLMLLTFGSLQRSFAADPALLAAFTQRVDSLLKTTSLRPFNGVVHISQHGETLYSRTQGYGDMLRKTPFAAYPQFVIGSVSKQVTAVLVLRACEAHLLALHTPIRAYLPELPMAWADTVTIHQLLCHTSGYQGRDKALAFRPGDRFSYSNQGYGLLSDLLAKVTAMPYEALVMALFKRCGMSHSTTPSNIKASHKPQGFSRKTDGSIVADTSSAEGWPVAAALLISNPKDITRWNECLHEKGKLLLKDSYLSMVQPSSTRPHPIFGDVDYGYGLQTTHRDNLYEISHGGYFPGFVSVNFYYPETQISLVVMENLDWMDPAFKQSFSVEMEIRRLLRESGLLVKKESARGGK